MQSRTVIDHVHVCDTVVPRNLARARMFHAVLQRWRHRVDVAHQHKCKVSPRIPGSVKPVRFVQFQDSKMFLSTAALHCCCATVVNASVATTSAVVRLNHAPLPVRKRPTNRTNDEGANEVFLIVGDHLCQMGLDASDSAFLEIMVYRSTTPCTKRVLPSLVSKSSLPC